MRETKQILVTLVGPLFIGFDILDCKDVISEFLLTKVPFSKKQILGIANCRGEAVPVINLAYLLNISISNSSVILVRVQKDKSSLAIAVESIFDVIEFPESQIKKINFHTHEKEGELISSVLEFEKGTVKLIDIQKLFQGV